MRHIAFVSLIGRTLRFLLQAFYVKLRCSRIPKPIPDAAVVMSDIVDDMTDVVVDDCDIFVMWFCAFWSEKRRCKRNISALMLVFGRGYLFVGFQIGCCLESREWRKFCMFFWGFGKMIETAIIYFFVLAFAGRDGIHSSIMQSSFLRFLHIWSGKIWLVLGHRSIAHCNLGWIVSCTKLQMFRLP